VSSGLITPRGGGGAPVGMGARTPLVAGQRLGRARRRLARRRLARLARVALGTVLVLVVGGGVVFGVRWVVASPRFAVASVEVRGAARVPEARIRAAAAIAPGANLWSLDTAAIAARVGALPEIRRADVIREAPNRVTIVVEERRPFTLVHAARLHWMDEDGRVLGEEARAVSTDAAIALIRALLRSGSALTSEISEIDMSRADGPVLYTVDGVEVWLGSENWDERLARLEGVLGQVATQDVSGVDLRFKDQVVLKRGTTR
jgi:cell division septal protein FtsQ